MSNCFGVGATNVVKEPAAEQTFPAAADLTMPPIEPPGLEKQTEATPLSLGGVPDLLKGLDGLVGPAPAGPLQDDNIMVTAMAEEHTYCAAARTPDQQTSGRLQRVCAFLPQQS